MKHVLCMHEDLRGTSQNPHKKPGVTVQPWNPSTGASLGLLGQLALLNQEAPGSVKMKEKADEMAQLLKALARRIGDLSSTPRTHLKVEGEKITPHVVL